MFDPRVAAASLSGAADAVWAHRAAPYVGCAFLGGVSLDDPTREAARALVARDRSEFLPADPVAFVESQLEAVADCPIRPAVNVRTTTLAPLRDAARACAEHDAAVEVNAHCRQAEMCDAGAGETLLRDTDRLCEQVAAASEFATTSVKVRAEVAGVELPELAVTLEDAGAEWLHVDAMDSESVIRDVREACDLFLVANNGVRDRETATEYLAYGADAVSVGRPSDDPVVLRRVREAVDGWFAGRDHDREVRA